MGKNEALEVVQADKNGITARKANGKTLTLTRRQAQAFAVFEKQDIEVSAGDKLLLQANWRDRSSKPPTASWSQWRVCSMAASSLKTAANCRQSIGNSAHGYAVTAHRSQGKTVDYEIIAAERMAQDLFYVSATRAREGLTVITSDSLALQESIGVSGDRQSASELERAA